MNINPIVIWVLRSPVHRVLSRSTMLIMYQGRKSGRQVTLPVNYVREGKSLWTLSVRKRKWWRNFRGGGEARLRLQGREVDVLGLVVENEDEMLGGLAVFLKGMPQVARYLKIWYDEHGEPDRDDMREAMRGRVMVRFRE